MPCFEEKPYFLRAELLRNWLAIKAIHKHSRMSTAGDREKDNSRSAGRLGKRAVAKFPQRAIWQTARLYVCIGHTCRVRLTPGAIILRFSFSSALQLLPHQNQAELATGKELPAAMLFV